MRKAIVLGVLALFVSASAAYAEGGCSGHSVSAEAPSQTKVTGTSSVPVATTKDSKS